MKMWKKRISLWLLGLLLSVSILTGCSEETGDLVGEIVNGVIDGMLSDLETDADLWGESSSEVENIENIETEETESETESEIESERETETETEVEETLIAEDGTYTSKEDVALYLYTYGELPSNFITKKEARNLGWVSNEGNLWDVAYGMSIGGDRFWNNEEILPVDADREYYECDIDYDGGYRDAKRIVYSNDGLIYYTEDHYNTFELLYDR